MANLAVWLIAIAWPIVKKVMVMMGIGTITYAALTPLVNSVIGYAQANFGQISGSMLQMISLAGFPEALGIMAGALVARVSFIAIVKIGKVVA